MKLLKIKIADEVSDFTVVAELEPGDLFKLGDVLEEAAVAAGTYRKVEQIVGLRKEIGDLYGAASKLYSDVQKAVADEILSSAVGDFSANGEQIPEAEGRA